MWPLEFAYLFSFFAASALLQAVLSALDVAIMIHLANVAEEECLLEIGGGKKDTSQSMAF